MGNIEKPRRSNKKARSANVRDAVVATLKGKRSPRLELKMQKKKNASEDGSLYVVKVSKRDDVEVYGAIASIGGKTLCELKSKYKKYSCSLE